MRDIVGPGEIIHTFADAYVDGGGATYVVSVVAAQRTDGTWIAWLQFATPGGASMRTGRETTQSSAEQVKYWAEGLQPTYLDGALERAKRS